MRRFMMCGISVLLLSCRTAPNPNDIERFKLAPTLLHDETEMTQYLAAFPVKQYKVYDIPGLGSFYVDYERPDDMIKNTLRSRQAWEPELNQVLEQYARPGTTVIDAGAHIGTHTLVMAKAVGSHGRIYAFEPQRKIFRELTNNLKLNKAKNVIALRFALGDQAAVIEMNPSIPANEGGVGVGAGGDKAELRTIDSFGFKNLSFAKIDVEGFEDKLLDGASATINEQHPVLLVEIQGGIDPAKPDPEALQRRAYTLKKLKDFGYQVAAVDYWDYLATYPKR